MNLTDNEIIKALEDAIHLGDSPIGEYFGTHIDKKTLADTLDLINRQKAEKKELWEERNRIYESLKETKAELKEYRTAYVNAQAEIERLEHQLETLCLTLKLAKSEAIKEFAEKVYKMLIAKENWRELKSAWLDNGECYWLKHKLRNLVKMTEQS